MMQIEFLGTGTSTGVPQIGCKCEVCTSLNIKDNRLRASALFSVDNKNILIDCGPDFRQQMLRSGIENIDAVLITHAHYDHTGGIDDLRPYCAHFPVPIYLEPEVAGAIRTRLPYCFSDKRYPGIPDLQLIEIDTEPFEIQGIPIIPIRAMHFKLPVLGFRIGRAAYITDMLTLPESEYNKLKDLDVLIINALRHTEHISHQNLKSALQVIERIAPKNAYLTHMCYQIGLNEVKSRYLSHFLYFSYYNQPNMSLALF